MKKSFALAKAEGLNVSDYFYEDVLLDEFSVHGYEKYLIKVSTKI